MKHTIHRALTARLCLAACLLSALLLCACQPQTSDGASTETGAPFGTQTEAETDQLTEVADETEAASEAETETAAETYIETETETETETEPETEAETVNPNLGKLEDPTRLSLFSARKQLRFFRSESAKVTIGNDGVVRLTADWEAPDANGIASYINARLDISFAQMLTGVGHKLTAIPNGETYQGASCSVLVFEVKAGHVNPADFFLYYGIGSEGSTLVSDTMILPVIAPQGTGDTEYLVFDLRDRADFTSGWINMLRLLWMDHISSADNVNAYLEIHGISLYASMEEALEDTGLTLPAPTLPDTDGETRPEADGETLPEAPDTEDLGEPIPTDPAEAWEIAITYPCQDGSVLHTYGDKTAADFQAMYRYHRQQGYRVYYKAEKDGNLFATLTRDSEMVHLYWYASSGELNRVYGATAADTLPPQEPAVKTGNYRTSITQLIQPEYVNGMGYVVQLADGSFIVYDGGYPGQCERLYSLMRNSLPAGQPIVIRAWVLTHSHSDHFAAFVYFAQRYADRVTLEHIILSPVDPKFKEGTREDCTYFTGDEFFEMVGKFSGVQLTYAHSGMEFAFCDLRMEILYTAEDLYKTSSPPANFNSSSILSRLYSANGFTVMMTGDSGSEVGNHLRNIYSDEFLRSDVIQFAHHAGGGLNKSFYNAVAAEIILYPCSFGHYVTYSSSLDLRQHLETTADYVKAIYIGGVKQYTVYWDEPLPEDTVKLPVLVERNT